MKSILAKTELNWRESLFENMVALDTLSHVTNKFMYILKRFPGKRAVVKSNRWAQFWQHSRKLGGATEHLIDGSEKRICRLSFEF